MRRQCLRATPCWQLQRVKALIYLGNMQAKCYVILLAHLDVRAMSLPSNQYGTVPGLISSISLIRPGRMLCWCGHTALGLWCVSLQGTYGSTWTCQRAGVWDPGPCCAGSRRCSHGVCSKSSPCWIPRAGQWLRNLCSLLVLESSPGETNDPVAVVGLWSVESTFQGFALLVSK